MEQQPLVSVVVITYNSSKTVIETLESIKAQNYQNLELIISDDGSKDNTVDICDKWLIINEDRFVKSKLLKVSRNSGVAPNCNRGVKQTHGEWIKLIAGDDILFDDCIESNIRYVSSSPDHIEIVFSKIKFFCGTINNSNAPKIDYSFFYLPCEKQLKLMLREDKIPCTPTSFIKKDLLDRVSYFDERFPMMEDYPMWYKLIDKGFHLAFMDTYTVYYRTENSLTHCDKRYINPLFLDSLEKFYKLELFPKYRLPDYGYMIHKKIYFFLCHICVRYFENNATFLYRIVYLTFRIFDIYWYVDLWKRKISK